MEQTRKNLKITSIGILIYSAFSLLSLVLEIFFGEINKAAIPADSPENILLITKIILLTFSVLLFLPELYIGIKGLKMAKDPDSSRAHIIWATIIFVLACIALISPLSSILSGGSVKSNLRSITSVAVDIALYGEYIRIAKAVSEGR